MKTKYVGLSLLLLSSALLIGFRSEIIEFCKHNIKVTFGDVFISLPHEAREKYRKQHPDKLNIALLGPWKHLENHGFMVKKAMSMAFEEINQTGGVLGRRLQPVWVDNLNCSADVQEQVVRLAADPSVFAVFGPVTSGRVLQFHALFTDAGLLEIAPLAQSNRLNRGDVNPLLFMPVSADLTESRALAEWAVQNHRNRFLILNDDNKFAISYGSCVEQSFFERDLKIYGRVLFDQSSKMNYVRDQVIQYLDYFPIENMIYLANVGDKCNMAALEEGIFKRLPEGMIYFNEFIPFDRILKNTKRKDRVFLPAIVSIKPEYKTVLRKFLAMKGYERDLLSLVAYRSVYIFADAARQAGKADVKKIAEVLRTSVMQTPLGEFRFTNNGFEKDSRVEILSLQELENRWNAVR